MLRSHSSAFTDRSQSQSLLLPPPLEPIDLSNGGGCAGFQYTFALIDEKDVVTGEDRVFVGRRFPEEAKVVCDEVSFEYLKGSTVDYAEEMIRSAFEVVKNPNAEQKCGCGVSFEAKF